MKHHHRLANPVGTWALFFAAALATLALARAGLLAWQWERVRDVPAPWRIFTLGLRLDLVLLCYVASVPLLLHVLRPPSIFRAHLTAVLLTAIGTLLAPWSDRIGDSRFETEGEWRRKQAGGTRATVELLARELRDGMRAGATAR